MVADAAQALAVEIPGMRTLPMTLFRSGYVMELSLTIGGLLPLPWKHTL
jgi:hypothetical protein